MKTFVLIVILATASGGYSTERLVMQEFSSVNKCQEAAELIKKESRKHTKAFCLQK